MRRKIAAGNWKMNGLSAALDEVRQLHSENPEPGCEVNICPPATLMRGMAGVCDDMKIEVGAPDVF